MWSQSEEFKGLLEKLSNKAAMDKVVDMAVKDAPYAYKDVCHLLEKQMKRSSAASKARLNVLYVISSICRKSKKKFGEKDKYGGRFTPRLETLSGYLAEMPSPYWAAVGKVVQSWRKERVFAEESLSHFNGFAVPPAEPSSEQHSLADRPSMAEPEGHLSHLSGFGLANAEASTGSVDKLLPPPLTSPTATATRLTLPVGTATMSTGSTRQLPLLPGDVSHTIEAGSAESSPTFPGHSGPPQLQAPPQPQPPGPPLGSAVPENGAERKRRSRWDTSDNNTAATGSAGIRPSSVYAQEPPPLSTIAPGPPQPAGIAQQPRYATPPALPPAGLGTSQWTAPSSHVTQHRAEPANVAWPHQPPAYAHAPPHWQSPHQYFRPPLPRPPPGAPPIQQQQQQHRPALPAHQQQRQPHEQPHSAHPHGPHQWAPLPPVLQAPTVNATEQQPQPTQQRAPGPVGPVRSEAGLQQAERLDVKQTAQELIAGVSKAALERFKGPMETWSAQYETLPPPPKRSRWEEAAGQPADQVTPVLPNGSAEPIITIQPPPPAPPVLEPSVRPEPARINAADTAHAHQQPDEKLDGLPPPPPVHPAASSMPLHATAAPVSNGAANSNAAIAGRQGNSRAAGGAEAVDVENQVARAIEIAQKLIGGLQRKPAIGHAVQTAGVPQPVSSTQPTSTEQKVADITLSNITDVEPMRQPPSIGSPAWSEFDLGVL